MSNIAASYIDQMNIERECCEEILPAILKNPNVQVVELANITNATPDLVTILKEQALKAMRYNVRISLDGALIWWSG